MAGYVWAFPAPGDLNAQVTDGALDLRMSEQNLDSAQIAGSAGRSGSHNIAATQLAVEHPSYRFPVKLRRYPVLPACRAGDRLSPGIEAIREMIILVGLSGLRVANRLELRRMQMITEVGA
jgi:hypothetical protein